MLYRRPGTSVTAFQSDLDAILYKIKTRCIIMGDFNLNLLDRNIDNNINNFINNFVELSYFPVINKPTRVSHNSATIIDNMWTNFTPITDSKSEIVFSNITDHFPIIYYYKTVKRINERKLVSFRRVGECFDNLFKERISEYSFDEIYTVENVDLAFEKFSSIIHDVYDETHPVTTKYVTNKKFNNQWITPALKQSIRNKNKLYKTYMKLIRIFIHPVLNF